MQAQRLKRVGFRSAHGSGSQVTTWLAEDPTSRARNFAGVAGDRLTEVIVALDYQLCSSLSRTTA